MSEPAQLKAVIFDLDGVLVSTSVYHAQAWAELVRSLGYEPPADLEERVKGISRLASLKIALGENASKYSEDELTELASRKNEYYLALIGNITPADLFPGVLELFDDLRRSGIRIVLGSASRNARPILRSLGIAQFFDAVADGYEYKHGKPHPDVFLTGARMVNAAPSECIVVEDAAAGITAALDGGFVAVGMGNYESLRHAHLFINSLEEVSAQSLRELHAQFAADRWTVLREGIEPEKEESNNTVMSVGNGRLGIRGRIPELGAGGPGTFLAGFYDKINRGRIDTASWSSFMRYWGVEELAQDEQIEACIVNCPDVLDMRWRIEPEGGQPEQVDFGAGQLKSFRRTLDLRTGMFTAAAHWVSPLGRELRLVQRRFADMVHTERAWVQYELEPLNFSGGVCMTGGISTETTNCALMPGVPAQRLYEVTRRKEIGDGGVAVSVKGKADGARAAFAARVRFIDAPDASGPTGLTGGGAYVTSRAPIEQGRILRAERMVAAARACDSADPLAVVERSVKEADALTFNEARIASAARWQELWNSSDVLIEGSLKDQLAVRFSIYQLLIAASDEDDRVSIPAKGLTGEGYRGMVFWDTDIYMTPFYNFTQPATARALAAFRFNTLDGARRKARHYGFRGASYPWETSRGDEECEKWLRLITHQVHITADVAYALQQYVDCTGDMDFYVNCAAEVLIETARFWLSRCVPSPDGSGQLSIPDAGGPDEYHVVENDSAFVNNMAIHNLRLAERAVRYLQEHAPDKLAEIRSRTGLTDDEIAAFPAYADRIKAMLGPDGLFEECRGFFQLKNERVDNEWNSAPQETQTVKQADVILLAYLLPDMWSNDVIRANWDYYEPRTVHASSLSHAVHGIVAAQLGIDDKAADYTGRSLGMDLFDEMGNASLGPHMAAHGMNWSAVVRGFAGARPQGDHFLIEPRLPGSWQRLRFNLKWRGADFIVDVTPEAATVTNKPSARAAVTVRMRGTEHVIEPGRTVTQRTT